MASRARHRPVQTVKRISARLGGRRESQSLPLSYYDLVEMFEKPGCAVCNLLIQDAGRFIDGMLYELALDADIQKAFRARRGLCNEHSWQLLQYRGMSLGIAILYQAALDETLRIIEETPAGDAADSLRLFRRRGGGASPLLADRLEPDAPCIVCGLVAAAEQRYIHTLGRYAADPRLSDAYRTSDGLCLSHFRQALQGAEDPARRRQLAGMQKAILSRLKADLDGFIDKNNYLHSHEISESEGNSWLRVVHIAGERGVFGPDRDAGR